MFDRALNLPLQSPCLIHSSNKIYVKDEHINDSESEKKRCKWTGGEGP